jgi:hypothetical protein
MSAVRGHLGEQGRETKAIAGDDDPEAQAGGLCRQRAEVGPRLERFTADVPSQGDHVVPEPRILEDRHCVGLAPRFEDVFVAQAHLACLDPEAHAFGFSRHGGSPSGSALGWAR